VIAPGEIVLRHTPLVRIKARLLNSRTRLRDLATSLEEDAALSELRGDAVLTDAVLADQHFETFRFGSGEAELVVPVAKKSFSLINEGTVSSIKGGSLIE
jgi:hypothetical protein